MSYGFKLTGITQPVTPPAINMSLSDGETTENYLLERSGNQYVADDNIGGSIYCSILNSVIDATTDFSDNITLTSLGESGIFDEVKSAAYLSECIVTVDGNKLDYNGNDLYEYFDEVTNYYYTFEVTPGSDAWSFNVIDGNEATVAGTYSVVMKHATKKDYEITMTSFDESEEGKEYTLNLSMTAPSSAFSNAINAMLNLPTTPGTYSLLIGNDGSISWDSGLG